MAQIVQRRLNKKRVFLALSAPILLVVIIVFAVSLVKNNIKKNSIEYKLEVIGYTTEEIEYLTKNLTVEEQNKLLDSNRISVLVPLYKEKYFRKDKLEDYLEYHKKHMNVSPTDIIKKVNTHTDIDFYEETSDADTSKNELVLVNKYYKLAEDYEPSDIVLIPSAYAYSKKYASESILEELEKMIDAAKEENLKLIVSAGYRSYKEQEKLYNNYKVSNGIAKADEDVSRAGHSDYQTGLAIDIEPYGKKITNEAELEEYKWLQENSYKYGFIERYPEGKEDITGFSHSYSHYRYVGVEAATYIHDNNITFEEYYGYKF